MSVETFPYGDLRFTAVAIDKGNRIIACFVTIVAINRNYCYLSLFGIYTQQKFLRRITLLSEFPAQRRWKIRKLKQTKSQEN